MEKKSTGKDTTDGRLKSVADIDVRELLYQPKTAATYGLIIKYIRGIIGFQHNDVLTSVADEVISIMKDPNLDDITRRGEIQRSVSVDQNFTENHYYELAKLCRKIPTSETHIISKDSDHEDEEDPIAVPLEDDDEALSDEYLSEINEDDEDIEVNEIFDLNEQNLRAQDTRQINLEELGKRQTNIALKANFGQPLKFEGYEEYHIEPPQRPQHRGDLIKISELPDYERKAFVGLRELNHIQSKIYKKATSSDKSLLICAPTGAGKTNIAMLAILREISKSILKDGSFDLETFKIIYIAPIKALVQEVVSNFTKILGGPPYNIKVEELTGDHQLDQRQISAAQIIVCTPEKWDIVTRKSLDRLYIKLVRLVIFDEIHLLHNDRGATLEALIARIKRHKQIEGEPIRILGLSATLPNYKEVARFIAPDDPIEESTFFFDSTYRPIPLRQEYIALTESKRAFRKINDIVYEKVLDRLVGDSQILIFVHSRPDTIKTAQFIKTRALDEDKIDLFLTSESAKEEVDQKLPNLRNSIQELVKFGMGVHHAGLSHNERNTIEGLFRGRFIKVLVSTATLAWGVNLPARTVIIKGTQVYRDGRWTDLDSLDVTQMLGRAGRPGYDTRGEGIVITQQSQVLFYMSLTTDQLPIESRLIARLPEFINAECVIGNVECLDDAIKWLSETYLSSRMMSLMENNDDELYMRLYGFDNDHLRTDPKLSLHRKNLAYTACCLLDNRGLIVFDRHSGIINSTETGRIASHYNCSSRTIKLFFDSIHDYTSDIELLRIFSLAEEFKDIFVRRGEELDLKALLEQVPFPIDDKRASPGANKVNALLQVYIFRLNIEGSELISDIHFIKENGARLARAIHEIVLLKGYAHVAELSFDLCRKIDKRMTICHTPIKQFADDLNPETITKLERKSYITSELRLLKPDKLTELLRCDRSEGEKLYKLLKHLPKYRIEASVKPVSRSNLKIDMSIFPEFSWSDKYHGFNQRLWLLVEDVNQEVILHYELIHVRKYYLEEEIKLSFFTPYLTPPHPFYYIKVMADGWFGCDQHLPIHIAKLSLPLDQMIPTQPLDVEPLLFNSLNSPHFEEFYQKIFKRASMNSIQTHCFKSFYNSDQDIILLAAAGSGKTTCSEWSVIRNLQKNGSKSKVGYIAANPQAARVILEHWTRLFGDNSGIYLLSGNHRSDTVNVNNDKSNIIIGDPTTWHSLVLLRSKKYAKLMDKFQLFIIDDIHILYEDETSYLEWICSKIRILTKLAPTPARIVALGSPILAAESLKNWLSFERGTKECLLFNFAPTLRPVKLDLTIQKFNYYDYNMRLLTMLRPLYRHIIVHSKNRPVIVFVADFRQALTVSESLLNYSRNEGVRFSDSYARPGDLHDAKLAYYIKSGIGYIHSAMSSNDRHITMNLFDNEQISLLICTQASCWSITSRSYMTIIMDTQHSDGFNLIDYKLTDIIQMLGLTGRPLSDHECKAIIMCQTSRANYFDRFLRDALPVESKHDQNLINLINFEVADKSIVQLNHIYKPYLGHTFFYKRIAANQNYYGIITADDPEEKTKAFGNYFNELVNKTALELEKNDFLSIEGSRQNPDFTPGLLSKISLEYFITYETLARYVQWLNEDDRIYDVRTMELIDLISAYSLEFSSIIIKHGELDEIRRLQRRHIPGDKNQIYDCGFKVKLMILSQYQKIDGRDEFIEGELVEDRRFVASTSYRLLMATIDIAWLKDSISLAKTAIQLAKRICLFSRSSVPNIEMDISVTKEPDTALIEVTVNREDDPFNNEEFNLYYDLPSSMYRDEGWCFLIHGRPRSRSDGEKFALFKRVKTPIKGQNNYKLQLELGKNYTSYTYDLYFMSDFYSSKEDRKVTDIDVSIDTSK